MQAKDVFQENRKNNILSRINSYIDNNLQVDHDINAPTKITVYERPYKLKY